MLEDYVVIDLEMTGLNAKTDAILEVGAVRVRDGRQTETYGAILKCGRELSERVVELTGITPEMAAVLLLHEHGLRKGIGNRRFAVILNQADGRREQDAGGRIAAQLPQDIACVLTTYRGI